MRCHKLGVHLASEFLFTFTFSVAVNDRLPSGGRFDDQLGIGEVPFASTLPEPPSMNRANAATSEVGLISHGHVVVCVLKDITGDLGTADNDHHRTVATNPRDDVPVRFSVHREVNGHTRRSVARIVLRESLQPAHRTRYVFAGHAAAKPFVDRSHVLKQVGIFVPCKNNCGPEGP